MIQFPSKKGLLALFLTLGVLTACALPQAKGGSGLAPREGLLYLASPQGKVFALNAGDGNTQWVYPLDKGMGVIYATPTLAGDRLYVATYSGKLLALEASSGRGLWSRELEGPIVASPVATGGKLYVAVGNNLLALDGETGKELWQNPFKAKGGLWASPVVQGDRIYLASLDHSLYALNLEGKLMWEFTTQGALTSPPLLVGDRLFLGSLDGRLYALEVATGKPAWAQPFKASHWLWGRPSFGEGKLFIGSLDKKLYALDKWGELVWEIPLPMPLRSSPVMVEGLLVLGLMNGEVWALEPGTGRERWKYSSGAAVAADLLAQEGKVFVHNQEGKVYSLEGASGRFLWSQSLKGR